MKKEQQTRQALREWLARMNGRVSAADIGNATGLVSAGILKSIHVMDLILWIEERLGRPVEVQRIRPGSFASIDAIYASFFSEEDDRAA
jgi:hypothetical protein